MNLPASKRPDIFHCSNRSIQTLNRDTVLALNEVYEFRDSELRVCLYVGTAIAEVSAYLFDPDSLETVGRDCYPRDLVCIAAAAQ